MSQEKTVLLVDDNEELCDLLKDVIAELGHKVTVSNSVEEAQKQINGQERFDSIIVDLRFKGGLDGLDLVAWTRGLEDTFKARSKFILMTGQFSEFDPDESHCFGINVFLLKLFDPMLLEECLNSILLKDTQTAA